MEGWWTHIPHISKPLLSCIEFSRRNIVSLKSVKISQNRQCHVAFFDTQKVHAGVPQTAMCELREEQNALYLSHCGECHDTERAYKKHLTKVRKLSSKGTALIQ